jgi:branched-chain amino acid transport system substrate-binding protein
MFMAPLSLRPQAAAPWWRLAAAALLAIGVAGCIPRTERPAPPPPPVEPVQEAPPAPVDPGRLPADEARHRVAVLVPLSGDNAALGQSLLNAANLALLDTGGQRIRITAYDTATGAAAAANEALADGNGLILGPLLADDVRAVAPVARARQVPVIAYSNDVSVAGNGVYIMGLNPGQSIERVVGHARAAGVQRFGALVPTGIYGQRASQAMIAAVEQAGGRMVGMQSFDRSASGLRTAAQRLAAQGQYDAVLIADGSRIAAQAVPLVRQGSAGARILGTELWGAEGDLSAQAPLRGAWFAAAPDAMFEQFRSRYRARFNASPYRLSALGYDSVLLAVRIAADWRIGRPFPVAALSDRTGFIGVDGAFRFGTNGIAERTLDVREVTASGSQVVSPAPRGFD